MLENAYVMVAIILVINIVYVSFSTIRMILTLKGRRYLAALISVFEMIVYVVGLGLVLDNLDQVQNVIAYAVGFGIGVIVGTKIEEKLALGYITVNVISSDPNIEFTRKLRDKGYGVTSWFAYGMDGDRLAMQILSPRKYELRLYETIQQIDPKAFIISYEPKQIHGGFWVKQVRKGRLFYPRKNKQAQSDVPPYSATPDMLHPETHPSHSMQAMAADDTHQDQPVNHSEKTAHSSNQSENKPE